MQNINHSTYLILAVLVLLPFGMIGQSVHYGHANTLIIAGIAIIALLLPNQWLRLFGLYLTAWLTYVSVGLFTGFMTANVPLTVAILDGGLWPMLGAVVFAVIYYADVPDEYIINTICISAVVQAVIAILQSFGINPVFDILSQIVTIKSELAYDAAVGTLGNNNFLAAFVATSLPFFFRRGWAYFVPVLIACLIVAKTTTAFAAAFAGAAFYFYPLVKSNMRYAVPVGAVGIAALAYYAFVYHPIGGNDRPQMWMDGITKVTSSWKTVLVGFGPSAVWKPGDKLHSEYVMTLYNFGIIGLSLMLAYIASVFKSFGKINRALAAAFVIICVDAIGNHLMHLIPTATLAIIIMALIERGRKEAI